MNLCFKQYYMPGLPGIFARVPDETHVSVDCLEAISEWVENTRCGCAVAADTWYFDDEDTYSFFLLRWSEVANAILE